MEFEDGKDIINLASDIRKALGISMTVIHCVNGAAYSDEKDKYWAKGPYCPSPLKSTGAGDRFNAGFALATVLELEPRERLLFAGATSGFFVRNGYSGSLEQIMDLITLWDKGEL